MAAAMNLSRLIFISGILRLVLIFYGEWQDSHMEVRYTDVDYLVFSDAADLVVKGKSPFERLTYRYSPLLALIIVPNSLVHRSWGKILFSASDLLVGIFVEYILKRRGVPENVRLMSVGVWLFNPFTFTIGTRGNCEPLVCAAVLWIIICLMNRKIFQAAFWYGLIVHFRVYPIIYSLTFVLVINKQVTRPSDKPSLWLLLKSFITKERILFGLFSGSVFFFWTALFFYMYGWDFLNEALLYHLTRTDPRHNFSIYFYHIYLRHQHGFLVLEKLISFLPQMMVQLAFIFRLYEDLPFCLFAQTVAFVAFNKVITAQYFLWFFCLLPLIIPFTKMNLKWKGLACTLVWTGSQIHWLMWAYLLEYKGLNVFTQLWFASLLFLAANTWVLFTIIKHHQFSPGLSPLLSSHSSAHAKKLK